MKLLLENNAWISEVCFNFIFSKLKTLIKVSLFNYKIIRQIDGIAPTFAKKPAIRQEDDGKRLLFECRIQADPKPQVLWSHNGIPVAESSRHKVKITYDTLFLFP